MTYCVILFSVGYTVFFYASIYASNMRLRTKIGVRKCILRVPLIYMKISTILAHDAFILRVVLSCEVMREKSQVHA